jgi:hypothetical protein
LAIIECFREAVMSLRILATVVLAAAVATGAGEAAANGERELGPDAILLTGDDLAAALNDVKAEGWSFDGTTWFYFVEHYKPDGSIVGSGGPDEGSDAWQWTGTWRAEAEQACFEYPELGSGACRQIYIENEVYKNVADGEVRAHWQPMK